MRYDVERGSQRFALDLLPVTFTWSHLIRTNLAKFVPQRVRELIEESPEAPSLDKREADVSVLFADISGYHLRGPRNGPRTVP